MAWVQVSSWQWQVWQYPRASPLHKLKVCKIRTAGTWLSSRRDSDLRGGSLAKFNNSFILCCFGLQAMQILKPCRMCQNWLEKSGSLLSHGERGDWSWTNRKWFCKIYFMVIRNPSGLRFAVTRLNYSRHGSKLEGLFFIFNYCQTRLH